MSEWFKKNKIKIIVLLAVVIFLALVFIFTGNSAPQNPGESETAEASGEVIPEATFTDAEGTAAADVQDESESTEEDAGSGDEEEQGSVVGGNTDETPSGHDSTENTGAQAGGSTQGNAGSGSTGGSAQGNAGSGSAGGASQGNESSSNDSSAAHENSGSGSAGGSTQGNAGSANTGGASQGNGSSNNSEAAMEAQTEAATEDTLTCTVSISCATILNNMDRLDQSKTGLVPSGGVILSAKEVTFEEGETVMDVLKRVCRENSIHMEQSGGYIEGINNIYEFDCGEMSGWMYSVNGTFPNYGSNSYTLKDGDTVKILYTCDFGSDIGGGR